MRTCPVLEPIRLLPRRVLFAFVLAGVAVPVFGSQKVVLTGTAVETMTVGSGRIEKAAICDSADPGERYSERARSELSAQMGRAGLDSSVVDPATANLGDAIEELCEPGAGEDENAALGPFTIIYGGCMMRMEFPQGTMALRIVSDGENAVMEVSDHAASEASRYVMLSDGGEQGANAPVISTTGSVELTATGNSEAIAGYPTDEYAFEYTMGLGSDVMQGQGMGGAASGGFGATLAEMMKVTSKGTVWIAETAPGSEIARAFHDRLAGILEDAEGATSLMTGGLRSLIELVRDGMPMDIEQRIDAPMGVSSYSRSRVEAVNLAPLDGEECGSSTIPENYTVTDLNEQMAERGADGSGLSPEQQAEAAAAMQEANKAMQEAFEQMTPQEREMLEGLGIVVPAGAAAANPAGAAAGRGAPSSESLTTDDLTQTVQLHLQALGYDVGNTDGTASMETTIAISQFQAEKGLAVTGEVTPQLAGILAAEVDSR